MATFQNMRIPFFPWGRCRAKRRAQTRSRHGTAPQAHIQECESASITWLLTATSFRAGAASAELGRQLLLFWSLGEDGSPDGLVLPEKIWALWRVSCAALSPHCAGLCAALSLCIHIFTSHFAKQMDIAVTGNWDCQSLSLPSPNKALYCNQMEGE